MNSNEAAVTEPPNDHASAWVVGYAAALKLGVAAAAAVYVVTYLYVALSRMAYPFGMEWLEDGMAQGVQRVLEGKPIYTAPSVEYIPFIYTPLYYYLGAAVAYFLEMGFFPLRLISFVASIGCFLVIFLQVLKETRSPWAAWVAVGMYAATFQASGAWFDLARVDSLFLFFILLAVFISRFARSWRTIIFAGIIMTFAFLTKHSAAAVALALITATLFLNWRYALTLLATFVLLSGVSCLVLDLMSQGWFGYYVFHAASEHGWVKDLWIGFWTVDLMQTTGILCALAVVGLFLQLAAPTVRPFLFYGCVTGGIVIMTWLSRVHVGGYLNVLMPTHAWAALLFGLALGTLPRLWQQRLPHEKAAIYAALSAICILQFALLMYDPRQQIPTKTHYAMGEYLLNAMADKEEVFMPQHSYLPALAGKTIYLNKSAYGSLLKDRENPYRSVVATDLTQRIINKQFDLIILNNSDSLRPLVRQYYQTLNVQLPLREGPWTLTGFETRPTELLVPR